MRGLYIGVDVGSTNLKFGVLDTAFNVKEFKKYPISEVEDPKDGILFIEKLIREAIGKYRKIQGVGIGLPGLVDFYKGYIHYLVNLKRWRDIKLRRILERKLKLLVVLDNDVNAATLGEYMLGAGRGSKNMLMLTLGTGVGGGLIISGELYRGSHNLAGEIGHMPIALEGPKCNCGGTACLESYIGNKRIIEFVNRELKFNPSSILHKVRQERGAIQPEDITYAAKLGDGFAIKVWEEVALKLGQVLVGVLNLLDIERIIIGGGVANAGRFIMEPLRKFVRKRAMSIQARNVKILRAKLGERAGVVGSALLARLSKEGKEV